MTFPIGIYFFRDTDPRSGHYRPVQASSQGEATADLRRIDARNFVYDGGCPAGHKGAGPYWAFVYFTATNHTDRPGAAWVCGHVSEAEAGNAAIDHCIRTSCARRPEHYLTLVVGNVTKHPMPRDQYHCADGHPNTRAGQLGPRTGTGSRASVNGYIQDQRGEDALCVDYVKRWLR